MMTQIPTLEDCKIRFAKFGECEHHYKEWIKPYGQLSQFLTCQVCAKQFEKKYPNQNESIKESFLKALNSGIKDKQEIYNFVANDMDVPRPTVRRVARLVREDLQRKIDVLTTTSHTINIATNYDCPECGGKKIIKKGDHRCPKCKVVLDWSDEK